MSVFFGFAALIAYRRFAIFSASGNPHFKRWYALALFLFPRALLPLALLAFTNIVFAVTLRTLSEQVALETRTRMLNPKWYEGMLEHGYEGVRQIEVHLTNTLGWSATTGQVQPWVYQQLTETFMLDPEMRERLNHCQFNNCLHFNEPGCAIKEAVNNKFFIGVNDQRILA